ncbi:N-acetylglucosamine kinase [Clostridium uliginosum]|uniref:BadF-type ATPase n=1 Tax=Clostridium uliginosum TaxID=119641 RepID=A0A1I1N092_9CLOT|nr:BadF/BadG/BcrA/BcrD ATPase family protein [Clostridium uliginosum]SFC90766.1 BadF-type ATPase [Clostridium uliginosum]
MFYIGVDGGGTKTKFTLMNDKEDVVGSIIKETCHYNEVGFDGLKNVFAEGLEELLKKCGITREKVSRACIGLAGYGELQSVKLKISEIIKDVFKEIEFSLFNDVQIAHAGALGGEDGIVIIAGTGSIGYSVNKGKSKRVGGWGYTIGDEGSAYWIGRKVIECFSKQADGRLEKGHLYSMLKEELNLTNDYELISFINKDIKASKGKTAQLAQICYKAAKLGDLNAKEIFNEAGKELANIINTLANEFTNTPINVSYIGGVFKSEKFIIEPIKKYIGDNIQLNKPKFEADIGACLLANKQKII